MLRVSEVVWLGIVFGTAVWLAMSSRLAMADLGDYQQSSRLYPSEYLLGSHDSRHDPIFDEARVVDLSSEVGIGSDCGRIDVQSTLKSTLGNVLNSKYFGEMGKDIIAGSPMLLTCYFSPTWCAILKHSQLTAQGLSQMRLNQCSLVDKYTDSRLDDFYQERQACVRRSIERNGGDMEAAMQSCNGNSLWQTDLASWAGGGSDKKVTSNQLIGSSAKWAGMDEPKASGAVDLVKALVGDTVVSRGRIGVDYGPHGSALTPRTYLQSVEQGIHDKLCVKILGMLKDHGAAVNLDRTVSDQELKDLSPGLDHALVDRQTVRALSYMGYEQREIACRKLAHVVGLTVFSAEMNRSLDILTTLSQNPNLPENRKKELEAKRSALKDQVETTLELEKARNEPINQVLSRINSEGQALESQAIGDELSRDAAGEAGRRFSTELMNCSDGVMCDGGN